MGSSVPSDGWGCTSAAVVLLILAILKEVSCQASCQTGNNQAGSCVLIENCPLIDDILRNAPRPLPANVDEYIKKSHCVTISSRLGVCCLQPSNGGEGASGGRPIPIQPKGRVTTEPIDTRSVVTTTKPIDTRSVVTLLKHRNIPLLPSTDCGPISTDKVAGGEKANLGEFPWMALIRYETPRGIKNKCGGSIINKRYVLTAAHCVSRLPSGYRPYSVLLGEQDTLTNPDCVGGMCNNELREVLIDKIIPHKSYNNPRYGNDIALIRLREDVTFNGDYIKPVCLPVTQSLVDQTLRNLIVAGWGKTENQTSATDLLKARLAIVPLEDCTKALRINTLTENQLCAKGKGIVDTCKGDSGGPLVYPFRLGNSARYIQFGIVNAGAEGCGVSEDSKPAIYLKVQNYMTWILNNIR